jgi:guanine deaminase
VHGKLSDDDGRYLRLALDLSRGYDEDPRRWPFGAVLVADGAIVGQGSNRVVELDDPTAHAEVMALRSAGAALGRYQFEDSVLYSSGEPCPMCLAACYWASVPRVVFAVGSHELADHGIQDLSIYTQLRLPAQRRSIREDASGGELEHDGIAVVRDWAERTRRRR